MPTVPVEVSPILEALDAEMAHFWMGVSGGLKIPRPMALIRSDVVDGRTSEEWHDKHAVEYKNGCNMM